MNLPKILLIFLLIALSIGALAGGFGLSMSALNGDTLIPPAYLENSPFQSTLIPGIVLFLFIGIFPAITAYGLITQKNKQFYELLNLYPDRHWSFAYSIYSAIILLFWLTFEIFFIGYNILQFVYFLVAIAILIAALLPGNFYNIKSKGQK